MKQFIIVLFLFPLLLTQAGSAATSEVSVERGLYLSIIGGCHDCHTEGYSASKGVIDPAKALKGSRVGFQGPWGTSYPPNLRLFMANSSHEEFLIVVRTFEFIPPMPGWNLRKMTEDDLRSLRLYVESLGEPGERAPEFVAPGDRVNTPFIVLTPQMPPACTRDLDCGIGDVCGINEPRKCVPRS